MTLCRNVQDVAYHLSLQCCQSDGRLYVTQTPGSKGGGGRVAHLLRGGAHRDVRLEETPHLVDRALSQFLRLLPRIDRDLGVRRQ